MTRPFFTSISRFFPRQELFDKEHFTLIDKLRLFVAVVILRVTSAQKRWALRCVLHNVWDKQDAVPSKAHTCLVEVMRFHYSYFPVIDNLGGGKMLTLVKNILDSDRDAWDDYCLELRRLTDHTEDEDSLINRIHVCPLPRKR